MAAADRSAADRRAPEAGPVPDAARDATRGRAPARASAPAATAATEARTTETADIGAPDRLAPDARPDTAHDAISGRATPAGLARRVGLALLLAACASDPSLLPREVCDHLDNDGDGRVDEGFDLDHDGVTTCAVRPDCDDAEPTVRPGAPERCDGVDDDCDGLVPPDELDADGDGQAACAGDCDDADPAVHGLDHDGDGWSPCDRDPDDADPRRYPGAPEQCDGLDDDADGRVPADELDRDGDGVPACAGDCDDDDPRRLPGDADGDGIDACAVLRDCDDHDAAVGAERVRFLDLDGDGWGGAPTLGCDGVDAPGDCDDGDPDRHPGAHERCDGLDDDCDGSPDDGVTRYAWYRDDDGDGTGSDELVLACAAPAGWAPTGGDCAPHDPTRAPGAEELCNGVDDDCDGQVDEPDAIDARAWFPDADDDGAGAPDRPVDACVPPPGHVPAPDDCDDDDPTVHPDATDPGDCDGVDEDCDPNTLECR